MPCRRLPDVVVEPSNCGTNVFTKWYLSDVYQQVCAIEATPDIQLVQYSMLPMLYISTKNLAINIISLEIIIFRIVLMTVNHIHYKQY